MVKPVDSSGSKGVVKIYSSSELKNAVEEALSYSRCGRFIVEEFIKKKVIRSLAMDFPWMENLSLLVMEMSFIAVEMVLESMWRWGNFGHHFWILK